MCEIERRVFIVIEELSGDITDKLNICTTEPVYALLWITYPVTLFHHVGEQFEYLQLYGA